MFFRGRHEQNSTEFQEEFYGQLGLLPHTPACPSVCPSHAIPCDRNMTDIPVPPFPSPRQPPHRPHHSNVKYSSYTAPSLAPITWSVQPLTTPLSRTMRQLPNGPSRLLPCNHRPSAFVPSFPYSSPVQPAGACVLHPPHLPPFLGSLPVSSWKPEHT